MLSNHRLIDMNTQNETALKARKLKKSLVSLLMLALLASTCGLDALLGFHQECRSALTSPTSYPLTSHAVADFDGDRLPDNAELLSDGYHKKIQLTLSSPGSTGLNFSSETQWPGSIHAEDIDHDNDNDLVWISDQQIFYTALWLNNGTGEFTRVVEPRDYTAQISRIIVGKRTNDSFRAAAHRPLKAVRAGNSSVAQGQPHRLPGLPQAGSLTGIVYHCAIERSPYLSRYPKRGPPPTRLPV